MGNTSSRNALMRERIQLALLRGEPLPEIGAGIHEAIFPTTFDGKLKKNERKKLKERQKEIKEKSVKVPRDRIQSVKRWSTFDLDG